MGMKPDRIGGFVFLSALLVSLACSPSALCKEVEFERGYSYRAGEADSKLDCRSIAFAQVKRLLLEEIGTYLESHTEIRDMRLSREKIIVYSAGVISVEILDEQWDGYTYSMRARMTADPDDVAEKINEIRKDRDLAARLEQEKKARLLAQKDLERLREEIRSLKGRMKTDGAKRYKQAVKTISADDWMQQGWALLRAKRYYEAGESFTRAIMQDKDNAQAYNGRGIAHRYQMMLKNAVMDYSTAIEKDPALAGAYYNRALLYELMKNHVRARGDFQRAASLGHEKAQEHLNKNGVDWQANAGDWMRRAAGYQKNKQHSRAVEAYTKTLEMDPDLREAYVGRAEAYYDLGRFEESVKDYNKALFMQSDNTSVYYVRGGSYLKMQKYAKAIKDYSKIIKMRPDMAEPFYSRGYAYIQIKNYKNAIIDFSEAVRLDPEFADAYSTRGYANLKLREYKKAEEDFSRALELFPEDPDLLNNRAVALIKQKKYPEAEADLSKAVSLDSTSAVSMVTMAELFSLKGQPEQACRWLGKAFESGWNDLYYIKTQKAFEDLEGVSCYERVMASAHETKGQRE
jgi:tetratricopeptide (TPR) repeat protein